MVNLRLLFYRTSLLTSSLN